MSYFDRYNHRERQTYLFSSLAITRIFGGLPKSFYDTYHEHHPKSEPVAQYGLRVDLYELFHYLNHTLLFGVSVQAFPRALRVGI